MIHLRGASFVYQAPDGEVEALRRVDIDIAPGEFCSVVGPSGCGKSTLLSVVSGLEPLTAGTVEVDGAPVRGPSGKVGFMPQRDQLFPWRTIRDNVTLGLTVTKNRTPEALAYADALLKRYGLWEFAGKRPSQLSGGMRQRCAISRIIRQEGKTALLVTHDISEAISLSDRIFVLSARPAVVKSTHDLTALQNLSPLERRDTEAFHTYFQSIWKELDHHE